ncbi:cell wall-binding repeat-containing protein [Bacillus carboniphilus]|uniref:Cell wall-binding repeat-containing protein n=1 Tax=Bacillus carboniphilus TaxID=86663 RepID=A0ABY9JZX0_9BACI|nr:cell wall-binding repeat-containing protein [Bacillus carboniphilus]WLR44324.1 cell wall-binding repeat-containing protein [Bacillus carboniphilus]
MSGQDRFETAANIAKELGSDMQTAIISYGYNFPDALAIASYAAQKQYPILLSETEVLPTVTQLAMGDNNINKTIIVGGTAVISKDIESKLPNPTRIGGVDRYDTASKLISRLKLNTETLFFTYGGNFP